MDNFNNNADTNNIEECLIYMTRDDIINFPFPYKLWVVMHLEFCDFLRWNRDGTVVLLDLLPLEVYLHSKLSIFKIRNRSTFLVHLDQYNFERLNSVPSAGDELILQYKNENFQRHRVDLLAKMRRYTYQLIGEIQNTNNHKTSGSLGSGQLLAKQIQQRASERMAGDYSFLSYGSLSKVQKRRICHRTYVNFQREMRNLKQKLLLSDGAATIKSQLRRIRADCNAADGVAQPDDGPSVDVAVNMFESPYDSLLYTGEDLGEGYAGYYGVSDKDQIDYFFADFLPKYQNGHVMMDMDISAAEGDIGAMEEICTEDFNPHTDQSEDEPHFMSTPVQIPSDNCVEPFGIQYDQEPINNSDEQVEVAANECTNEANVAQYNNINIEDCEYFTIETTDCDVQNFEIEVSTTYPPTPVEMENEYSENNEPHNFFDGFRSSMDLLYNN